MNHSTKYFGLGIATGAGITLFSVFLFTTMFSSFMITKAETSGLTDRALIEDHLTNEQHPNSNDESTFNGPAEKSQPEFNAEHSIPSAQIPDPKEKTMSSEPKKTPDVFVDITNGQGWNSIHSSYPIGVEHIKAGSVLVGKQIDTIRLTLSSQGVITGMATVGVFDEKGEIKFKFGTQDVSQLSTTDSREYFYTSPEAYTIIAGDRIGIMYAGGDSKNWLRLHQSNENQFDHDNAVLGWRIASTQEWADGGGDGGDLRICMAYHSGCTPVTDNVRSAIQSWTHCSSAVSGYGTKFDDIQTNCYTYWSILQHGDLLKSFRFKLPAELVGLKSIAASSAVYQYGPNDFELALYDDIGEKRYKVQLWELPH
jgi:hypothetical protein